MKFFFNYKIGDRVICVSPTSASGVSKGETGVVVNIRSAKCSIGVCWDIEEERRHTCDRTCKERHGWYVSPEVIALK